MLSTEISAQSKGTERVLHLVKEVGGTRYVTGHGARNYLDHAAFEEHGISVDYMDYDVRAWGTSADFTPYVTALDLLAHAGPKAADYLNPKTRDWRSFTEA
ncbi:MAG: WbqC family protein [Pseudomonadota bacterium]